MAAKENRGHYSNPVSTNGKPSWFDIGTADMINVCASCHVGGGTFEGIPTSADGTVVPFNSPGAAAYNTNTYDRDFYSYPDSTIKDAYLATDIATAANVGDPVATNWTASGVMEADCLLCHIDPEHPNTLQAADGLKADPNRPRMMIFAERNGSGEVTKVSLGSPLHTGLENGVVRPYTDSLNRMSRPTSMMALMQLPKANVGEMMDMWTAGLKAIEDPIVANNNNGTPMDPSDDLQPGDAGYMYPLPFALYGQNVPKIWDGSTGKILPAYCPNPYGVDDEMARLGANNAAITSLFTGFKDYLIANGFMATTGDPNLDMQNMMGMFFNDFIYAYNIKFPMDVLLPVPYGLRAYDQGRFYTDIDDFQASTRDYVRNPAVEGQGGTYAGRTGLAYGAMNFGMGLLMCGDMRYNDPTNPGYPNTDQIVADWQNNETLTGLPHCDPMGGTNYLDGFEGMDMQTALLYAGLDGEKGDTLPSFYNVMPTAELMGLDLNNNGLPLAYVQLLKDDAATATGVVASSGSCSGYMVNDGWCAKTYYEYKEVKNQNIHEHMFGSRYEANSPKWTRICGTCHVMVKDHGNSEVELVRKYNLGMSADFVKNGQFVNRTDDPTAEGYDVHMSPLDSTMGCGACHLLQPDYHPGNSVTNIEAKHNFFKGTDTAHNVRNDLDNKARPKNCEQCHVAQIASNGGAASPIAKHEATFGEDMGIHMEKISCQTCHIPYKKTWRFRSFDDTLGYFGNFDNLMGYDVLGTDGQGTGATYQMMAFPSTDYAISPVYGASPGYGIPHFNMVAQTLDANGLGQTPMDYVSEMVDYFHITKSADPGQIVNGMPTNPRFDFWKYFFQMFFNMKIQMLGWDKALVTADAADQLTRLPLYYGNGTNGYPQVVSGNPITILTWVDAAAGDDNNDGTNEMGNIAYGGARVLYLRELIAPVSIYKAPTQLDMSPAFLMSMASIPANDTTMAADPRVGKLVLKDSGYTIYDHTGDMYPDIWWTEDVRAVQAALKAALIAEGRPATGPGAPNPMLFMAAHYFSDTHGVKPANVALGAGGTAGDKLSTGCTDCHGNMATDAGAHQATDRILTFLPWNPPWFTSPNHTHDVDGNPVPEVGNNHAMVYNHETGAMVGTGNTADDGGDPFIIVDGEVAYIDQQGGNNISFLGAKQKDVLELSHHHSQQLLYMKAGSETLVSAIPGLLSSRLTAEEKAETYVPMITDPLSQLTGQDNYMDVDLRPYVSAFGYVAHPQKIRVLSAANGGEIMTVDAKVFNYDLNEFDEVAVGEARDQKIYVKLYLEPDYDGRLGNDCIVVWQPAGSNFDDPWIRISGKNPPYTGGVTLANQVKYNNTTNAHTWKLWAGPGRYAAIKASNQVLVGPAVADCNGDLGGVAFTDHCGTCVGGNTGLEECEEDCANVYGGSSYWQFTGAPPTGYECITP